MTSENGWMKELYNILKQSTVHNNEKFWSCSESYKVFKQSISGTSKEQKQTPSGVILIVIYPSSDRGNEY